MRLVLVDKNIVVLFLALLIVARCSYVRGMKISFVSLCFYLCTVNFQVGLALVVEGEIVLGVMGCPNWHERDSIISESDANVAEEYVSRSGIIMISHVGCGTWRTKLLDESNSNTKLTSEWTRCIVDGFQQVHEARFCIPESQTWESLPLSPQFSATTLADNVGDKQILLLPLCCGRFTFNILHLLLCAYDLVYLSLSHGMEDFLITSLDGCA